MPSVASTPNLNASRRRRVAAGTLAGLALIGGAATFGVLHGESPSDAAQPAAPPAPHVTVAAVEAQVLTEFEELTGRVEAMETVELRARVSGHVQDVHFQAGQLVNAGDLLFTIDPRWYRAHANLAAAEVERARVRVAIAEREARRAEELLGKGAISVEEADARRSTHAEARAALLAAEAALTTARLDLENTDVRAPIAGRISRAFVTAGNLVSGAPGNATVLARIVSTGDAYVYADVDENTALRFNRLAREGRLPQENGRIPVELQLADEDRYPHRGYIESSDNRIDPATGTLALRMVFANPDGELVPGLFARVRIPISEPRSTVLVSERAIGTDQSQKFVLTLSPDNTLVYRPVDLGPRVDDRRVVRSGLQPGEIVVVNGLQRVRPGMVVEPERRVAASDPSVPPAATVAAR